MLTRLIVVIISQYLQISSHYVVHLNNIYVNYTSIKKLALDRCFCADSSCCSAARRHLDLYPSDYKTSFSLLCYLLLHISNFIPIDDFASFFLISRLIGTTTYVQNPQQDVIHV